VWTPRRLQALGSRAESLSERAAIDAANLRRGQSEPSRRGLLGGEARSFRGFRFAATARDPLPPTGAVVRHGARASERGGATLSQARLNGANPSDYLTELQRHSAELKANPSEWMPWNWCAAEVHRKGGHY
jgi:hypothetical protein